MQRWVVGGVVWLCAAGAVLSSCSSTVRDLGETAGAPSGEAGSDESAGALEPGGAGSNSNGGADQSSAGDGSGGASGGRDGNNAGATSSGAGGAAGAVTGGTGGTGGNSGLAGMAGSAGGAPAFGTCRAVTQEAAPNLTAIKGTPTPPALMQGLMSGGRYRRTAFDYYAGENSELVGINTDFVEVEVKGAGAAIYFDKETWLITMGTPATAVPESVVVKCSETGSGLSTLLGLTVGVEQKGKIFYQVTTASAQSDGFQIMVVNPGASWYRAHYSKVP